MLQKWQKQWETKLEGLTPHTHGTIDSRFEVVVVIEASMSPSWTKAMLQGGPRVSVIPCYRSWVGWPAQHSTELPDAQRWFLCRKDLGGCDRAADVRAVCGSFLPQCVVLISLLYTGHNETTAPHVPFRVRGHSGHSRPVQMITDFLLAPFHPIFSFYSSWKQELCGVCTLMSKTL